MVKRLERCMEQIGERNVRCDILPASSFPQSATTTASQEHHQAHVMLGSKAYSYDDQRRMPLYLLNNLLGGPGMNARLNLSLREKNGLVYTVESAMASYSDTGCWSVYFGCDHHDVKRCLRLVHRELDKVMQHPLTERQLTAAKRQLKGQIAIACDNREQFALDIAKNYLHYGRERDINELLERIDAITAMQIQEVAQELFAPERLQQLIL
jgi:predicted Zn-dependent peptidase